MLAAEDENLVEPMFALLVVEYDVNIVLLTDFGDDRPTTGEDVGVILASDVNDITVNFEISPSFFFFQLLNSLKECVCGSSTVAVGTHDMENAML